MDAGPGACGYRPRGLGLQVQGFWGCRSRGLRLQAQGPGATLLNKSNFGTLGVKFRHNFGTHGLKFRHNLDELNLFIETHEIPAHMARRMREFLGAPPMEVARRRYGRDPARHLPKIDACLASIEVGNRDAAVAELQAIIRQIYEGMLHDAHNAETGGKLT